MTTAPPALADYLRTRPGRCPECVWHVPTMGHASTCPNRRPDEPRRFINGSRGPR